MRDTAPMPPAPPHPAPPHGTALEPAAAAAGAARSPAQQRFHALLQRVEKARARLQAWQEALPRFAAAHAAQVQPLRRRFDAARREWAFELEQIVLTQRWSHAERAVLDRMILDICRALLDPGAALTPDAELKALFNRVSPEDYDQERARVLAAVRSRLEQQAGVDLSDSKADSADALVREAQQRMAARAQAEADRPVPGDDAAPRRQRRTPAQKRAQAAAAEAARGAREVYRRLAALLHPDRTPAGATAAERQARHDQMSEANAAYAAGDLLTLLTLQQRWEPDGGEPSTPVTETQVRQFNQVLARQLADLEADIREREEAFIVAYGPADDRRPDPLKLDARLKEQVRATLAAEATLAHDRRLFRRDPVGMRRLLREIAQEQRARDALERLL